jgi:hypothetical protein
VITYSLGQVPVSRNDIATSSDAAKLMAEIFERVLELEELKKGGGVGLIFRLANIGGKSTSALATVLHVGCGQVDKVLCSYEEQVRIRGLTRQAMHYKWQQDRDAIKACFPELAKMLQELRDSVEHHEDAMSAADAMRMCNTRTDRDCGQNIEDSDGK